MPRITLPPPGRLTDLVPLLRGAEGFPAALAALEQNHSCNVDGAWGSSAALAAAALGTGTTPSLLIVLAHPFDLDGWSDDLFGFTGRAAEHFPAWDTLPATRSDGELVVDEITGQRLRLLKQLQRQPAPHFVLTTIQALLQPVPSRAELKLDSRILQAGSVVEPDELARWLVEHGFQRAETVELPGQFGRRGGILDVFPLDVEAPYRIEFFGDDIESLRQFSPQTQRSEAAVPTLEITAARPIFESSQQRLSGHLCDYLPARSWTVLVEPDDLLEQARHYLERIVDGRGLFSTQATLQKLLAFPSVRLAAMPLISVEATCHLRVESVERFSGNVAKLREELATTAGNDRVVIACHNEAERQRLAAVLGIRLPDDSDLKTDARRPVDTETRGKADTETRRHGDTETEVSEPPVPVSPRLPVSASDSISLVIGRVHAGFRMVDAGVVVLGDHELFHREDARPVRARRRIESRAIDSFLDLTEGDLVVHVAHGIARYRGMQLLDKNGQQEEHLILEFRDRTLVYVPVSKIELVQKYVGGSKTEPELSKLGGTAWQSRKARVESAVFDLASDMVELQALRESQPGISFPSDTDWQAEFEAAFPYEETPDQLSTLVELKQDMERPRPMDRLICGDVGYGKTELAIRAAFKAIDHGKQVAVLVPTTVLAEQHFRTFSQRLAEYPFVVEGLSRFRTGAESRGIVERLGQGGVDVIIGTHRLLSADVQFKDLGLVIIDEEQRFGVEHKERLKKLRQTVDVLTMTATPIPRTLHLSLLGIRDISNLETPPADRLAIETRIVRFDPTLIRHAILRELNREGQIFFVHNRVHSIGVLADRLKEVVPEARISIAHGQMAEGELEQAMLSFVRRDSDILLATTIIESGLDIPNANTIFIDQADIYGLADLHQLRGRVGRYKHRAYCYLLLDPNRPLTPIAARRLKAIEEFTELGAGFKIALRDLEIRGAGNILGTQQSGHIAAVGYELYCQLLEDAVRNKRNQPIKKKQEVTLDLPVTAFLPRDYVEGQKHRIEVYRRLARIAKIDRLDEFAKELRDRFGPLPEPVKWLLRLAELRLLAARWQVATIHLEKIGEHWYAVLGYRSKRLIQQLATRAGTRLRVADEESAYYRLKPAETEALPLYKCLREAVRLEV